MKTNKKNLVIYISVAKQEGFKHYTSSITMPTIRWDKVLGPYNNIPPFGYLGVNQLMYGAIFLD